ncbi:acyltransferase [Massilia terrae]|uniref:Acyltransferase n=1 Tax=Massilia terrae TaxID=1811224 RepID=A0ABT2D499_9BURK|nr:acyltransferase [Massilia terrae]MCS0661079.1 acyltransferase [Massilia terrae]
MDQSLPNYSPSLDGWRALAIGCLYIGHFSPVPGINLGAVGVNLFFVLSGLLMARILFVRPMPIPIFYKRRIARVFPSLYVFILAIAVVYALLGVRTSWSETAAALSFTNNYFLPNGSVMPFGHVWSLCVEEHSYVLLSLVALGHRAGRLDARRTVGLLALLWLACAACYSLVVSGSRLEFGLWRHSEVSAFGIFAAAWVLLRLEPDALRRLPPWSVVALALVGFAAHWWSVPMPLRLAIGTGAFALAVNMVDRAPSLVRRLLSLAPLRQLGLWSFSLYLWQQPFYLLVWRHGMPAWQGILLALASGITAYYLLEMPARNWLNRRWGAPDRKHGPAAQRLPPYGEVAS